MVKCIECDKPAVWTRHTQFAGNHPYCEEHAKKESDWNENDSYTYWKEDRLCSLEEAEEFSKKRDYVYEWNGVAPSVNAQWNVTIKDPWDEWKATKDIV